MIEGWDVEEPVCTEGEVKSGLCTICERTETDVIPDNGHTPVSEGYVKETCTTPGKTAHEYCSVCDEDLKQMRLYLLPVIVKFRIKQLP